MLTRTTVAAVAFVWLAAASSALAEERPLIEAVKGQNAPLVKTLARDRRQLALKDGDGATALHWAVHRNNLEIATLLVRSGIAVNDANDLGVTPLLLACEHGSEAMVRMLLAGGANANAAANSGETPLMAAARSASVGTIASLLENGADPNAREATRGQTPLMWAVAAQQPAAVKLLIAAGADVHARTASNKRLVYTGSRYITAPPAASSQTVVEADLGRFSPILFAAQQGNIDITAQLLAAGANKDDLSPLGQTPLIVAAHSDYTALVQFLLDRGANPNLTEVGYTALHSAVLRGNLEMLKALLRAGADRNAVVTKGEPVRKYGHEYAITANQIGATPLWLAARFAEAALVRELITAGAALDRLPRDATPVTFAILAGRGQSGQNDRRDRYRTKVEVANMPPYDDDRASLETMEALLAAGASVNDRNKNGDTLLHVAATQGFTAMISLLANKGADINATNGKGLTPLAVAQSRKGAPATDDTSSESTPPPDLVVTQLKELGGR